jgi:hypothetical protein
MTQNKLADAEDKVVAAAVRFSDCAAEFDGDLQYCSEYLDALWTAVDGLKQARAITDLLTAP